MRNERGLIVGNPAMARKDGATVDLALYDEDPEYRAAIDAKIAAAGKAREQSQP